MKIIVTHASPDMDAITSVWLIRRFLSGWENATTQFVPAGERIASSKFSPRFGEAGKVQSSKLEDAIEHIGEDEVIHVDTGLGPLDHHQTASDAVCAASLTWDYIRVRNQESGIRGVEDKRWQEKEKAISRMVKVVVDTDHFKEVFWPSPTADYYEFSVGAILDGLKLAKPNQDEYYVDFISECLDAVLHEFENRIWAEEEIAKNGIKFITRFGKGIGFETINDSVIKLAQKMGYVVVIRKDPRKGYVRVKAIPKGGILPIHTNTTNTTNKPIIKNKDIDLTLAYERLKKMDPTATWFLHIGKKMLLNGSVKNPKMRPTTLSLEKIIDVLKKV